MVFIRSGNPAPLAAPCDNCFVYEKDELILNEVTRLYTFRSLYFLITIMNLYSIQGEWILDGHSGTGKYMEISWSTCLNYFLAGSEISDLH